jgi:hemin uptake protein HemP
MSPQSKPDNVGVPITNSDAVPLRPSLTCTQVKSTELLQGRKAVDIEHNGSVYRLQTTRMGKLILTK